MTHLPPQSVLATAANASSPRRSGQTDNIDTLRYKHVVKRHLKATHITVDHWETLAQDRQRWRQAIHKGKSHIGEAISQKYQHDHNLRHGFPDASVPIIVCVNCGRGLLNWTILSPTSKARNGRNPTLMS